MSRRSRGQRLESAAFLVALGAFLFIMGGIVGLGTVRTLESLQKDHEDAVIHAARESVNRAIQHASGTEGAGYPSDPATMDSLLPSSMTRDVEVTDVAGDKEYFVAVFRGRGGWMISPVDCAIAYGRHPFEAETDLRQLGNRVVCQKTGAEETTRADATSKQEAPGPDLAREWIQKLEGVGPSM